MAIDLRLLFETDGSPHYLVPVVGLPYGDYENVRSKISEASRLRLKPVDDNPHDPRAIEVWLLGEEAQIKARVGFVPKDLTHALSIALLTGALAPDVPVRMPIGRLTFSLPEDLLNAFLAVTGGGVA